MVILTMSVWQDNWPVTVAATNSDPTANMIVPHKKRNGTVSDYPRPMAITQYNQYMGGVTNSVAITMLKSVAKILQVFVFMFDLAITNSFILAKLYTNIKIPNLNFSEQILQRSL